MAINNMKIVAPKFNGSAKQWIKNYETNIFGLNGYPEGWCPQGGREDDIQYSLGMIALRHFGHLGERSAAATLKCGVDVAVDYFCGDWWKEDARSSRVMDKSKKKRGLVWFSAFSDGLLLSLISKRWKDAQRICDWLESDIVPDDSEEGQEKELGHVYKIVASALQCFVARAASSAKQASFEFDIANAPSSPTVCRRSINSPSKILLAPRLNVGKSDRCFSLKVNHFSSSWMN